MKKQIQQKALIKIMRKLKVMVLNDRFLKRINTPNGSAWQVSIPINAERKVFHQKLFLYKKYKNPQKKAREYRDKYLRATNMMHLLQQKVRLFE